MRLTNRQTRPVNTCESANSSAVACTRSGSFAASSPAPSRTGRYIDAYIDTYVKRPRSSNFTSKPRISISQQRGTTARRSGRRNGSLPDDGVPVAARSGEAGGGVACLCFGDSSKPSNDFESTRLVARIIQFEYVYRGGGLRRERSAFPSRNSSLSHPLPPRAVPRHPRGCT